MLNFPGVRSLDSQTSHSTALFPAIETGLFLIARKYFSMLINAACVKPQTHVDNLGSSGFIWCISVRERDPVPNLSMRMGRKLLKSQAQPCVHLIQHGLNHQTRLGSHTNSTITRLSSRIHGQVRRSLEYPSAVMSPMCPPQSSISVW